MKKTIPFIATALLLAGAALEAQTPRSVAQNPRHVYLYEDFSTPGTYLDTTQWDVVSDTSYRLLYYTAFANAGGLPPEALWGYAPSSGMSRRMAGTYRLVSEPHALSAGERAYVAVRYYYYANQSSAAGVRSFGLAVRIAGGEWMPCRTVEITKTMPATRLVAELPAECRGAEEVQVAVCFNTETDRAYYTLNFDDIEFFSYPESYHALDFAWHGRPYAATDTLAVDLRLENTGNAMTSCKIAYTFDGGEPQTISLTFPDTLMSGESYTLSGFKPVGWETVAPGHHTVVWWLSEADGQALSEAAVVKQVKTLSLIDSQMETFPYTPLVEEFSSSSCTSCRPRNEALKTVFENLGDRISVVKYQMYWPGDGDPYYMEDGGIRKLFYDIYNVPEIFLNGRHDPASGGAAGMQTRFAEKIGVDSWFDISLDTLALDNDTNIYIVCSLRASVPMDGLRLHTVVLEGQTEGNATSNGETEFHHVALKMLPDGRGRAFHLEPDTVYTFRYGFDMKRTFMEEIGDLKVVCFLQADDDSVLQSANGDVTMRIAAIPVATEAVTYEIRSVYPNPASEYICIDGLEPAIVELFDRNGRCVFRQAGVQGDYRLDVRSYPAGLYILRIREGRRVAYAKVSVVG